MTTASRRSRARSTAACGPVATRSGTRWSPSRRRASTTRCCASRSWAAPWSRRGRRWAAWASRPISATRTVTSSGSGKTPGSRLAGRAPVGVAAGELPGLHRAAADQAGLAGTAVDVDLAAVPVDPGWPAHRLRGVRAVYGIDPTEGHPLVHQRGEVGPDLLPRLRTEVAPGGGRR